MPDQSIAEIHANLKLLKTTCDITFVKGSMKKLMHKKISLVLNKNIYKFMFLKKKKNMFNSREGTNKKVKIHFFFCLSFFFFCLFLLSYLPTPPLGQDMTQDQFLIGI